MAKSRGSIERGRQLEKLPFVVECPIPAGGLRGRLDAMHAWARARCGNDGYMTTSRDGPPGPVMPTQILRVHFADEATAWGFAREFNLSDSPTDPAGRRGRPTLVSWQLRFGRALGS